jgi:hypothetical protein
VTFPQGQLVAITEDKEAVFMNSTSFFVVSYEDPENPQLISSFYAGFAL